MPPGSRAVPPDQVGPGTAPTPRATPSGLRSGQLCRGPPVGLATGGRRASTPPTGWTLHWPCGHLPTPVRPDHHPHRAICHRASASEAGDHPKAQVAGRTVRSAPEPGRHPVPATVGGVAQVGATPLDPERAGWWPGGRGNRRCGVVAHVQPVRTPLPDVPGHVEDPVPVGLERIDRGGATVAVCSCVPTRELALEDVHAVDSPGLELVTPGER